MIPHDIDFIRQVIADTVLFRGTDKQLINTLSKQPDTIKSIKKGETIYTPEKFAHSLGIVIAGVCKAKNTCGNKTVLLNEFKQGDIFGAAALFTDDKCYVSEIVATTDCTANQARNAIVSMRAKSSGIGVVPDQRA